MSNQYFSFYWEIQIKIAFWYIFSNSFDFYWVFKGCFNWYDCNFDNVSKTGYSRPPKINGILKKGYDVTSYFFHVTQTISYIQSCDQSFVALAFKRFDQKNRFFWVGWSWFKFNNLGLALVRTLKFYSSVAKGLNLES